jgi:hypothetical protein
MAKPVTRAAVSSVPQLTLAQLVELERQAEAEREQRLLAEGPADDFELNKMLIQDLADYDEDPEVRAAAAAVLLTNDPVEFTAFLDNALPVYRAAANQRKKRIAEANREAVQRWAEEGGPIVRQRAAAALATNSDTKIADFVAIGKAAADAADKQAELNAADQAKLIQARVEQIVASNGYEVRSAGQMALDSEDPATIAEFYNTGYKEALARDNAAQSEIQAALTARTKAISDLVDLARRSTQAANARKTIIESSVAATKSLTITGNSMALTNKYAKQADAIYTADIPVRKAGGKTHTADISKLRADACAEVTTTARNADQAAAHAGVAGTAAETLIRTGLSNGVAWAEVILAQKDAGEAAKYAAQSACSATQTTEAAAKTLDADRNATVEANNAVKYRQAAEREQAAAAKLADQAEKLAAAAEAAEAEARKERLRAEQEARDAWAKADDARAHYERAVAQRNIAREQMSIAVTQMEVARDAASRAVAQQGIAAGKGEIARKASDELNAAAKRFRGLMGESTTAVKRAQQAVKDLDSKEYEYATLSQEAIAKKGTAEGEYAAQQAKIIENQLPGARAAASSARAAANTASAAASAASAAADRAAAAAAAAQAEASAAAAAAAGARRDAEAAAAAAKRAIADAQRANEYARQSVNVARGAINHAAKSKANAELTKASAEASTYQAGIASFQSRVAGRSAIDARVSAMAIADPAASAIDLASWYGDTDNDAAMALDIAYEAMLIGAEQSAAADKHATDAAAAAVHATEQATKAQGQIKPAYEAAAQAAKDAERAIKASKKAIAAAIQAVKEAQGAVAAAKDATKAAQKAAGYAQGAQRMAVEAGHDAAVARQAANSARGYAATANAAANNAGKIAKQIEATSKSANLVAGSMKQSALAMTNLATTLRGSVKEMTDAESKADMTAWIKQWTDYLNKTVDSWDFLPKDVREYLKGFGQGVIDDLGGLWIMGNCGKELVTLDPSTACGMLMDGIKELFKNPGSLIHLDEWKNGEYAKFFGLITYDVATILIPTKVSKIAKGVDLLQDGLTKSIAKMLSGDLLHGIKKFGSGNISTALKDLGSINLSKLIDIDFDMPDKFSFSAPEVKKLKQVIDLAGFPALEKALRDLDGLDLNLGDLLDGLLEACKKGDSFTPDTRVLLADRTTKRIAAIRVGDRVLATDPLTGRTTAEKVTDLHRNLDREFADVTVTEADGSRATIRTTADHPIWNATDRRWDEAADLKSKDSLLARRGSATVADVRLHSGARHMHNLTVANVHTYYVMADRTPVLVHNCGTDVPKYGDSDLLPSGVFDKTYNQELKVGPEGNSHFPGDPVGSWRDVNGRLHDLPTGLLIKDYNKPNLNSIDVGAKPDSTGGSRHVPQDSGPGSVRDAVGARNKVDQQRKDLWNNTLGPIATKLRAKNIEVNEATLSPKNIKKLLDDAAPHLSRDELDDLGTVGRQYNKLAVDLRNASEQLGTAGGAYVARTSFPNAKTITNGEGLRGTPNNLDRVLLDESGTGKIIVIEEKGAGSGLGSRLVDDPGNLTGPRIRAEQMSTEYLRHMLQYDNKLGPALSANPTLRARFQQILSGTDPTQLEYLRVTTAPDGVVTVTRYLIDAQVLGRGVISVAGTP